MVTLGLKKKMEEGGGFFRHSGKANNTNSGPPTPRTPPISTPDSIKGASLTVPERPSVDTIEVPSPTRNNEASRRTASEGVSRVDSQVSELSSPEAGDTHITSLSGKDPPAAMLRTTSIEPDHQSSGQASGGEQSSGKYPYHRAVATAAANNANNNHDPPENSIVTKVLGIVDLSCGTSTPTPTRDIRQVLSFQPEWGVKPDPDEETLVSLAQQQQGPVSVSDYHQNQAAQFPQANIQAVQAETAANANATTTLAEATPVAKQSPGRGKRHENFELVYKEPQEKKSPNKKGVMGKLVHKFAGGGGGGGGHSSSKKSGGTSSSNNNGSSKKKAEASSSFTAEEPIPLGIARRDVAVAAETASPSPDPVLMTSGNLGVGSPVAQFEETSMMMTMDTTKDSGGGGSSSMNMPKVAPVVEPVEYQEPPPTEKTNRGIFRRKKKEDSSSPTKNNNATASDDPAATTTPNGDEPAKQQMRFKKVLKSIKGSSKMPLEAITEEDGDDGAASYGAASYGAASYGENFVRVPGIQSADAFISDKDLIGDEIVEEIYADLDKTIQAELEADHQPLLPKNDNEEMPKTEVKSAVAIEATKIITKQKTTAPKGISPKITTTLKKKTAPNQIEPVLEMSRNRSWVERLGLKRSGSKEHKLLTDAEHKETPTTSDTSAESSSDHKLTTTAAAADNNSSTKKPEKPMWKAVVDKNTGKTYYYHRKTRETTWKKPDDEEIVHASEKKGRNEKEIQAMLRSKEGSEPEEVWEKKKEIARMLTTMAPPNGTSVERLVTQFRGKEDQLLSQLRDLKESKPFDEPLTGPNDKLGDKLKTEMVLEEETPLVRTRTSPSIYSGFSGKSRISDKTEQIKNTSKPAGTGGLPRAATAGSHTTSISSRPGEQHPSKVTSPERIPKNIPVPRTRELNVEEFSTSDRIYRTRRSNKPVRNTGQPSLRTPPRPYHSAGNDNYFGDNEFTDKDNMSYATDSISALSDADLSSLTDRKEQVVDVRRRALDRAIAQEDWELAAHLSESLRTSSNYKSSGVKREIPREWAQSEVDRSILESDWDAVTAYIAQVRTRAEEAERAKMSSHLSSTSSSLKTPPPITSVASASSPLPMALLQQQQQQQLPPQARTYAAAVKIAPSNVSDAGSNPQKRFGARSQLQHEQLNTSVDSYSSGYSTYDSEYTSASSYTDEDAPRPAVAAKPKAERPRPQEFAC